MKGHGITGQNAAIDRSKYDENEGNDYQREEKYGMNTEMHSKTQNTRRKTKHEYR